MAESLLSFPAATPMFSLDIGARESISGCGVTCEITEAREVCIQTCGVPSKPGISIQIEVRKELGSHR